MLMPWSNFSTLGMVKCNIFAKIFETNSVEQASLWLKEATVMNDFYSGGMTSISGHYSNLCIFLLFFILSQFLRWKYKTSNLMPTISKDSRLKQQAYFLTWNLQALW